MATLRWLTIFFAPVALWTVAAGSQDELKQGASAFGDWHEDRPGLRRKISVNDLPAPFASSIASNSPHIVGRPANSQPKAPAGFSVELLATGFSGPRTIKVAPNGDLFVAETDEGRVRVMRSPDGPPGAHQTEVFARGLGEPFGIAFYPPGSDPQFLYVASTDRVVRFRYKSGEMKASGAAEVVVASLPDEGGHSTRDIAFSPDGKDMFVSVGSATNNAARLPKLSLPEIRAVESRYGRGASWAFETERADVLVFDANGGNRRSYANGLRNCVGLAIQPGSSNLWCTVNERDELGDNLPPDFVTSVRKGAFYGWPWYYIGAHPDPAHAGQRSDLAHDVTLPDVLLQAHSAPLGISFYGGSQFPAEYRGDAFVALHGSWNRARRTGYKVIRVRFKDGRPTGEYDDFLTGFVVNDRSVWGRPVGVAVTKAGALLATDDANGTIWRITYKSD
jgi:glucose/arabinose dehydrogenase